MAIKRVMVGASTGVGRAGLVALISGHPHLEVIGSQVIGRTDPSPPFWQQVAEQQPELVVLDVDTAGWRAWLTWLEVGSMEVNWLLLTEELLPEEVSDGVAWGLRGHLPRDISGEELVAACLAAAQGLWVMLPEMVEGWLTARSLLPTRQASFAEEGSPPLTAREMEVLSMLAEGLGNKTIAKQLHISEHTVKFHVGSILSKLSASSRTEAVTLGVKQGLIML
ncbi:MAG: response regulator transcription factor [Cyanobacteriota bacterium]|nr:response regulator transcription factor [Cyanobacteriota bacterium]